MQRSFTNFERGVSHIRVGIVELDCHIHRVFNGSHTFELSPGARNIGPVVSPWGVIVCNRKCGLSTFNNSAVDVFARSRSKHRAINNYICQGFQQLIAEYEKLPHPTENALRPVTEKAKACLAALNNAAMIDPDDHVADILIFENCEEIVDAMRHAKVHEKREDGSYRTSTPLFTNSRELSVPGEKDSWSTKARYHRQFLIEEYKAAHPLDNEQIAELQEEKAQLEAELAVLKEEKKSKGFFNFSEKGEVKERMRPYEAKLSEVNSRIYAIEHGADTYIEDCLKSLSASFTRLHF